ADVLDATLQSLLETHLQPDQANVNCVSCGRNQPHDKQLFLQSPGPLVLVHLGRFAGSEGIAAQRLGTPVTWPDYLTLPVSDRYGGAPPSAASLHCHSLWCDDGSLSVRRMAGHPRLCPRRL